jgi:TPP-dependent pyruvate/acetoin dehydrogenase alpha subunit
MASKSFESPLISHLRMRAMYRGLLEVRHLGTRLGKSAKSASLPRGFEACWVGTAVDLKSGDLTSDSRGAAMIEHIRDVGQREAAGACRPTQVRKVIEAEHKPFAGSAADRLLCAVGAAMALKASTNKGVVLAYFISAELTPADWRRMLGIAGDGDLPLLVVAVGGSVSAPAGVHLPIIPVDAADAVAIYRVAQECILRAREDGGAAVIACVPSGLDPIKTMAAQLLTKGICTSRWIAGVEEQVRRIMPNN